MAPGSFLGLSLIVGVCLAGVVAQQYYFSPEGGDDEVAADYSDQFWPEQQQQPSSDYVYSSYGDGPVEGQGQEGQREVASSEEAVFLSPYPVPGPPGGVVYYGGGGSGEADRGRDGWGKSKSKKKKKKKKKGKKKKKCKKKKKGGKKKQKGDCDDHGGWGPVSVSTSGVQVGWKGWIPPVKGAGWGWFGEKSGHFSFTDKGGWGHRGRPHFPDPGPPTFIKHGPVHHKVIHQVKGWGWGGGGGGGGGGHGGWKR